METIFDLLRKEINVNNVFKMSALDILKDDPDFEFVGKDKNGVPVFELKSEEKCEVCGKTAEYCNCEDHA